MNIFPSIREQVGKRKNRSRPGMDWQPVKHEVLALNISPAIISF